VVGGSSTVAAKAAGVDIAHAVPREIIRALCIVRGGDCYRDRAACDVASDSKSSGWHATVFLLRFGHDKVILREERSDHSVLVTLTTAASLGLEAIDGAEFHTGSFTVGGAISDSIIGSLGHGKTWVLRGNGEADALIAALADGRAPRPADREVTKGGFEATATASRASNGRFSAGATGTLRAAAGKATDHRDGSETYFVEAGAAAVLSASATLRNLTTTGEGGLRATARLALTRRDGRWIDAALLATGEVSGSASVVGSAREVSDTLNTPVSGARRWVVEAHLDLTKPGNHAAANALLDRLGTMPPQPGAVRDAAAALARRIDDDAVIDVRAYALDRSSGGSGGQIGDGLGIGYSKDKSTEKTRLVAATTRGQDREWNRREDCLKEARR
jgi:hypothetical protein